MLKKVIPKIVEVKRKLVNPWEKTAKVMPDGSIKIKDGLEKLLLTKKDRIEFTKKVRINTRLQSFKQ